MRRAPGRRGARPGLGGDHVEGIQAVAELLRARRRAVREVVIAEEDAGAPAIEEIRRLAQSAGVPVRRCGALEIARLARTEVPQGVIAFAEEIAPVPLAELVTDVGGVRPFLVALDGVTDPGNLGALLRSALCAGATGVVLPRHHAVRLTPAAVKSAAGAVEHLTFALAPGIPAALRTLADAGVWSIGLDERGSVEIDEVALFTEPVALVLGAEGPGLAPLTRERCDVVARIALAGPLRSLNVSAAAAIACFAVARARRGAGA